LHGYEIPGKDAMTPSVAELLARKQHLLERQQVESGLNELDEIERLLIRINTALNSLDGTPIENRVKRHWAGQRAPVEF